MTQYDVDGNRDTVLNRARRFFTDNPDEMLTRVDMQVKFDCSPGMAQLVARALIREGIAKRDQLPRPPRAPRSTAAAPLKLSARPFPHCLSAGMRAAVEAYIEGGSIVAAAEVLGCKYNTVCDQLKHARARAGLHTTAELAIRYMRDGGLAEAPAEA